MVDFTSKVLVLSFDIVTGVLQWRQGDVAEVVLAPSEAISQRIFERGAIKLNKNDLEMCHVCLVFPSLDSETETLHKVGILART